ncbi:MAG TPA: arylamine N-acetyltransferase [Solirubrobacteraceae bacterium]|nr:arylamine N-acetyltransferase [Solirubrobacteraceae bacterium]
MNLAAYLERIGVSPGAGLAEVHRAHVTSIPFENLDSHAGIPVSLAPEDLEAKLVTRRRGGYCFEHNLLLAGALTALGLEVEPMLGRVRLGRAPGTPRPRTHLVLRVRDGGRLWLADVGFGNGTLLEPIPFGPGEEHVQSGWRFRVAQDGAEHVLQTATADGWVDVYGFVPEPVPVIDIETSNWFTCTHPSSPFVTGLIVAVNRPDGTRVVLNDREGLTLARNAPGSSDVSHPAPEEIPGLLDTVFGLPGFALDEDGRVRGGR